MAISNPVTIATPVTGLNTTANQASLTTNVTVPSGGKIFFFVFWFDATATLSSVAGGGYTFVIEIQGNNSGNKMAICSADATTGLASGSTITATFSAASAFVAFCADYSTGVATGAGHGGLTNSQSGNTTWTSTAQTVTSGDILIGSSHWEDSAGATNTASGGNTELQDFTTGGGASYTSCYQIGTGASIASSGTWSLTSSTTLSQAVIFSAAAVTALPRRPVIVDSAVDLSASR